MFRRRACTLLAPSIPRSVWDPAHHNTNWVDSYATPIADRRHWPAKKWSIGLEPRTPEDWLRFSYRNLAYAYNGALRACTSFPEMLVYYKEMKQRGVKVDVDTLNILLTRAARYERIQTDDIFLLYDEVTGMGARPDIASAETLHTVLEHSAGQPLEWQESRRRQLIEIYNYLALEEIERLSQYEAEALLAAQVERIRRNLRQLHASLSPSVYRRYFSVISTGEQLLRELHNFLWEFVSADHPSLEIPTLDMRIPFIATVMKRPPLTGAAKATDFEDTDVCSVFLAAVERCVDGNFHDVRPLTERRLFLSLLTMLTSTGVLYTADLLAQLLDVVKFNPDGAQRDKDAVRILKYALRGSSARHDEAYRRLWRALERPVDARVVGRYLAARDPWSPIRICHNSNFQFTAYPTQAMLSAGSDKGADALATPSAATTATADSDDMEGVSVADLAAPETGGGEGVGESAGTHELRTAEAFLLRWRDSKELIKQAGVLTSGPASAAMEVFTGQAVLLRTVASGQRYGNKESALSVQAAGEDEETLFATGLPPEVWEALLRCVQELRSDMDKYMEDASHSELGTVPTEPEFECWEAMLVTLRCILDYCVLHSQQLAKTGGTSQMQNLFKEAAALRHQLVEESRTRFNGRLRILWLHEA